MTQHCSSSHAEAASHIAEPEGQLEHTTVYWGALGQRGKNKDWQQMLVQGQSLKNKKRKNDRKGRDELYRWQMIELST